MNYRIVITILISDKHLTFNPI